VRNNSLANSNIWFWECFPRLSAPVI